MAARPPVYSYDWMVDRWKNLPMPWLLAVAAESFAGEPYNLLRLGIIGNRKLSQGDLIACRVSAENCSATGAGQAVGLRGLRHSYILAGPLQDSAVNGLQRKRRIGAKPRDLIGVEADQCRWSVKDG
jgi:hypothetical protein